MFTHHEPFIEQHYCGIKVHIAMFLSLIKPERIDNLRNMIEHLKKHCYKRKTITVYSIECFGGKQLP